MPILRPQLPPGVANYITPAGAKKLRDELEALIGKKSQSVTQSDDPVHTAEQRKLQTRIRHLQQVLLSLVVTEPPASDRERVAFGALVTVRHENNEEIRYRIVGVDESDPSNDVISWRSPLAQQLAGKRAGDRVRFRFPAGEEELEILAVNYE